MFISTVEASVSFPFCDKYNIEGVIDFECQSIALKDIVARILEGEIIRDIDKVEPLIPLPMKLTKEDMALAQLLFQEKSAEELSLLLGVEKRSAERKRQNLYIKCKVKSLLGLYKLFCRNKLVEPSLNQS